MFYSLFAKNEVLNLQLLKVEIMYTVILLLWREQIGWPADVLSGEQHDQNAQPGWKGFEHHTGTEQHGWTKCSLAWRKLPGRSVLDLLKAKQSNSPL